MAQPVNRSSSRERRVWLHIGAPKTGTTYLQGVLAASRPELRSQGVLYPGNGQDHFLAALDLRETPFMGYQDSRSTGAWQRVVSACKNWPGDSLISHEVLGIAKPRHVEQAMEDLAFAEVHVVLTARDLVRQAPAVWQESVKNRGTSRFTTFMSEIASPEARRRSARAWRAQEAPRVLARWATSIPPSQVHVVTLPQPGASPTTLLERFVGLLGVDPASLSAPAQPRNPSLGAAEVRALAMLNARLPDELDWPTYELMVKRRLAEDILARREGQSIMLSEEQHRWARKASKAQAKRLRKAGYDIVGSLSELVPDRYDTTAVYCDPDAVPTEQILDVVLDAITGLLVTSSHSPDDRPLVDMLRRGMQGAITRLQP